MCEMIVLCSSVQEEDVIEHVDDKLHVLLHFGTKEEDNDVKCHLYAQECLPFACENINT